MFNGLALVAVKDDQLRRKLVELIGVNNFGVQESDNLRDALRLIYKNRFSLVVSDYQIAQSKNLLSGSIIRNAKKFSPQAKTILLSSIQIDPVKYNIPADAFVFNDQKLRPIEDALINLFGLNAVELYKTDFAN